MRSPQVYVDFLSTDDSRRLLLVKHGTVGDLERQGIELQEGLCLRAYSDDLDADGKPDNLVVDGVVHFDEQHQRWVLEIDWSAIQHESALHENDKR